jgi:phosphopantetheinyl transferase
MENFPQVIESLQLPIEIPIRPYLKDHCINGQAVLPAVEAMEALAQVAKRFRPSIDVFGMTSVAFDKFLYIDTARGQLPARADITVDGNGTVQAALTTKIKSKHGVMARVKTHAVLTLPRQTGSLPEYPLDMASAPEGVCFSIQSGQIYPDLVAFGPSYRNLIDVHLSRSGAVAEVRNPVAMKPGAVNSYLLGSPFALDASFHAACAWGQRFAGIVAFPVAVDLRRIYAPTVPGETYFIHVLPVQADPSMLVFDLRIYDREGCLHEACSGVRMRDVSGGKMRPPEWIRPAEPTGAMNRFAGACEASAVIELAALSPFAVKTLSRHEQLRLTGMGDRRRRSYLAARLACKRISRQISNNDTRTAPGDIVTVCADRPSCPCCPLTDGRSLFLCSVSHDKRFAVAVAAGRRVGVDVARGSERLLRSRSLFMSEPEQALNRRSHLGEIESAVRIWSIKEAVAKALDITLAEAWRRVQVDAVDSFESHFYVDGYIAWTAVHDTMGEHVFTLVRQPEPEFLKSSPPLEP